MSNTNFEFNQNNPALTDTWVQWCGNFAVLIEEGTGNDRAQFPIESSKGGTLVERIKAYCVKNGLRCSKISGERILI